MTTSKMPGIFAFDMDAKAEEMPDFPVVTFDSSPYQTEVLTYADLVLKGRKLARHMTKLGMGRGDTFAVLMRNHPENPIAFYAASALGAIMVPIDPRSKGEKLRYQIKNSGSKGVLYSAEFLESMSKAISGLPDIKTIGVVYKEGFGVDVQSAYPDIGEVLCGPEAPAFSPGSHTLDDRLMILYSSGTTGDPKGVHLNCDRLQSFVMLARNVWKYRSDDKLYNGLSLSHGNCYAITLLPALLLNIPAVISRKFTKSRFWDIIRAHKCTCTTLLGGMLMGIYSEPPRPNDADNLIRLIITAGTPRLVWEAFEERFDVKLHEWYATTEGGFASNPPGGGPIGSFGKPLEGFYEMRVVRKDGSECEPHEIGELVGRNVQGETRVDYHDNPEASAAKIRDGWLLTGDMCHRDEEGWFFFDFRRGGGLRRQGDFIIPEYVEKVIAEHPHIDDVCVYGIPASSGSPGESDLVAAILPVAGVEPDIRDIFKVCVAGLERNSIPSYFQVVAEIPKTPSEKNLDRILREAFSPQKANIFNQKDYL